MIWNFIILWLKLLGLIVIGNLLLATIVVLFFFIIYKREREINNPKLLSSVCQILFIIVNTLIYIKFLNMALDSFELEFLNRKYILLLFIPIISSNRLLNSISQEYSKDYRNKSNEDFEEMDYLQRRTALQNIMLAKSLNIGLAITFWIQIILLIVPSFQNSILNIL